MKFFVYSRNALDAARPHEVPHVIISITSSPDDVARLRLNNMCRGVSRLSFPDAEAPSELFAESVLFSREHATTIWAFVEQHVAEIQRIVVHCDAGVSRSPAVAAALARVLNGDDSELFGGRCTPNQRVHRTLLETRSRTRRVANACLEKPDAGNLHVRIRWGPGNATTRGYPTSEGSKRALSERFLLPPFVAIALVGCGARTGLTFPEPSGFDSGGRADADLAADASSRPRRANHAVLFGGATSSGWGQGTWTWDGATWSDSSESGPGWRAGAAATTFGGAFFLFGGAGPVGTSSDAWAWNGATWQNQFDEPAPSPRYGAVLAALHGKIMLFGGVDDGGSPLADTWTWDGATWTEQKVSGPSARAGAVAATVEGHVVLFGGEAYGARFGDTWSWDGERWTELSVVGPSAREWAAMASLGDVGVLFGGESGELFDDTWIWDGSQWTQRAVAGPSPRQEAATASLGDAVLLFGGADRNRQPLGDTWTWDGTRWTEHTIPGPSARFEAVGAGL